MRSLSLPKPLQSSWRVLKQLATVRPAEPKTTIGLDMGSSAVKVVVLGARTASGARPLIGQRMVVLPDGTEPQMASIVKEAISGFALPVKSVNVSVSGQSVIMRVIEMPTLAPHELAQALPFEAQRYLPFNIQDVVLDGTILGPAEGKKLHVLIVACKRDLLERRLAWVTEAGFEPAVIDVDALALANAWIEHAIVQAPSDPMGVPGQADAQTCAVINVGAQWTNLAILKAGHPFLVRDIPWGATKLIRHIAEQLGRQDAQVAASLAAPQDAPLATELLDAAKQACESLTTDLQLSFDFFENNFGTTPAQLAVSGGLSRCPGFVEALKSHLTQPLALWEPLEGLTSQFAVAYGLALRRARP